jgi:glycosyltransferase involved in cell wall biosynthesis
MNLVLLTHPAFLGSQSQPHFARLLLGAYRRRGHTVSLRQPQAWLRDHVSGRAAKWATKWAGYVDQYLVFPRELRRLMANDPADTLYVFCDQALGPWVPLAAQRPHVVHCHDLLALRSALGLVPENPTSATGRIYQRYIRAGFSQARHFISVSEKSRADLHAFGGVRPITSDVVHNGMNHPYRRQTPQAARRSLQSAGLHAPQRGLLLHVGGGQWYKNTEGVVQIYARYAARRQQAGQPVQALWMVSPAPSRALQAQLDALPAQAEVRFLQRLDTDALEALYSLADALLFPSLDEGFGWPIAEGLACGCPVLTTGAAPMNEVGGAHAFYLERLAGPQSLAAWAEQGASVLIDLLGRPPAERDAAALAGIEWSRRFDAERVVDAYLRIYEGVLAQSLASPRLVSALR